MPYPAGNPLRKYTSEALRISEQVILNVALNGPFADMAFRQRCSRLHADNPPKVFFCMLRRCGLANVYRLRQLANLFYLSNPGRLLHPI